MTDLLEARRRSKRRSTQIGVTLFFEDDPVNYVAYGMDVSLYGMRLQTALPLAPGQHLRLVLSDCPSSAIAAHVVWLSCADSKQPGEAGIEFLVSSASPA